MANLKLDLICLEASMKCALWNIPYNLFAKMFFFLHWSYSLKVDTYKFNFIFNLSVLTVCYLWFHWRNYIYDSRKNTFFADDLRLKEDKIQRLQADNKHTLESLAIILSTPSRFVESLEATIKDRIHEILTDNQEKIAVKYIFIQSLL